MACHSSANLLGKALFVGASLLGGLALVWPSAVLALMPPCLITTLTGQPCWGCGMTHAVLHILHGAWFAAWDENPRAFVALPLLLFEYASWSWRLWLRSLYWRRVVQPRQRCSTI